MSGQLSGQVVLITGAGRGIGRALATRFAYEGASLALMSRTPADIDEVAAEARELGATVIGTAFDVSDPVAVADFVARAQSELGPIDLLINNAGRTGEWDSTPFWEADLADWWARVETNLRGPVNFCRAALPSMVARGSGRVVQLNSLAGATPVPWTDGAYPVSKSGLFRLTDQIASQLSAAAITGVVVLDVSPGLVKTREGGPALPASAWTPVERVCDVIVAVALGRLDALTGRFVHASDDIDELVSRADDVVAAGGRSLRMRPAWEGDVRV